MKNRSRQACLTFVFMVIALMPSAGAGATVDASSLTGKVMCGYQGWFNTPDDGMALKWTHWTRKRGEHFEPGNVSVDLWPDVSEFDPKEKSATSFRHADGSVAMVFSSANRATVRRHFEWMRDYGIDGAFLQRFANGIGRSHLMRHKNVVLENVRDAARRSGRIYAVMYDLSGLPAGGVNRIQQDWKRLREQRKVTNDPGYLHHEGKPVVAVWGIGFNDGRKYTLAECRALVEFLKQDGCTVMLGVPTGWRELNRDAIRNPALHAVIKQADIVSPWTIGRYRNPAEAGIHGQRTWRPDIEWCAKNDLDFLPVVFPGFSWHNLRDSKARLDQIPRLKGQFLWSQFVAAKRAGAGMIYVAMFDEIDEATAIFKCTNDPPVGDNVAFLDYEGLPPDHYLWLTGQGARMLREKAPIAETMPTRDR